MCCGTLNSLLSGVDNEAVNKQVSKSQQDLQKDRNFQALIKEIEDQKNRGFSLHPKMEKLRTLLIQHFANRMIDQEDVEDNDRGPSGAEDSRVMVFASYRDCVDELVEMLSKESPLVRATRFIGQATDKQGRSGLAQREQVEVSRRDDLSYLMMFIRRLHIGHQAIQSRGIQRPRSDVYRRRRSRHRRSRYGSLL